MTRAKPRCFSSPVAVLVRGFLFCSFLWMAIPWLPGLFFVDGADCYRLSPGGWEGGGAELRSIRGRLSTGHDWRMGRLFPEGRLFSSSFYGFTLVNLAVANPQDRAFRQEARAEVARLVRVAEDLSTQPPFDQGRLLVPQGGIIAAGHTNLLRAGYAVLRQADVAAERGANAGAVDPIIEDYHRNSQLLFDAFAKSPVASLETYPTLTWPVDNLAALQSLHLHDYLYGTSYSAAVVRWSAWMRAHLDAATGLLVMRIDQKGVVEEGPRGCGLSWTLAFLPDLDPALAASQYAIYREKWFRHPLGTTGIREWPEGSAGGMEGGGMDPDSGPVLFGIGAAASGIGIAAAKANHDTENLTGLLRGLHLLSFPAYSFAVGEVRPGRAMFAGQVLLADELALWGRTLVPWDAANAGPASAPARLTAVPQVSLAKFMPVLIVASLLTGIIGLALLGLLRRAWRGLAPRTQRWSMPHRVLFIMGILTLMAWMVVPYLDWLEVFLVLALLEIIETRMFPMRVAEPMKVNDAGPQVARG